MFIVAYFSRIREFRADKGGAQFSSRAKMIDGPREKLKTRIDYVDDSQDTIKAMKISS